MKTPKKWKIFCETHGFKVDKVELKAEKPSHRTFASLCDAFKCLVNMDSLGSTYTKRCAVYETNTGTFSQKNLLYKDSQWNGNGLLFLPLTW